MNIYKELENIDKDPIRNEESINDIVECMWPRRKNNGNGILYVSVSVWYI